MFTEMRSPSRALALCVALFFALSCSDAAPSPSCGPGETRCGALCVDVSNDPMHCGSCEATCDAGNVCDLGRCGLSCTSGTDACDGRCRDLDTDPANCGECGTACDANELCSEGVCGTSCTGALEVCDGICRDVRADPLHCGDCATVCDADQVCTDGLCADACADTLTDCGGACRDLASDADHCGQCAMPCATGEVCSGAECATSCADGLERCGADCVDLATDARHCNACDMPCAIGQSCAAGVCDETQHPPAFTSTPILTIDEDLVYTYAVTATDTNGASTLTLAANVLPAWLVFADAGNGTGTLSGTPTGADIGLHSVVLVAYDGTTTVEQTFEITVAAIDDAPVFLTTPTLTGGDDVAYTYGVQATDEESATVIVTATTLPAWLTFTDAGDGTYTLAGTPSDAEIGEHAVVLEASDGTRTTVQSFTITIADVNDLPVFTSVAGLVAAEDMVYTYEVTASDPDPGTNLVFTASTLPAWLVLTDRGDGTAGLTGTPGDADVGDQDVVLVVSDGIALVSQSFRIVVANTNDAPAFTSSAITTATEDVPYTYTIASSDADLGDVREITASALPGWLTLVDHADGTATLSGQPANADSGAATITLTVTDVAGATDTQTFTIEVAPVDDPPVFTSTPITTVLQDANYAYDVAGTDEENAPLTVVAMVTPAWLVLTDHGDGTATLTGTPGGADVGTHDVTLALSDGVSTVTQTFQVFVEDVADAPVFVSSASTSAVEDSLYSYAIAASDADAGAVLVVTATVLPAWLVLVDQGDGTAILSGTPTDADIGSHPVTLSVTDGSLVATQSFTIVVANTNDAPSFTSTAISTATEDQGYVYTITTTDPDAGTTLALTAQALPAWLTFTAGPNGGGTLSGTPTNAHVGDHTVTLSVTDGISPTLQSFTITVANTNDLPTFTSSPVTSGFVLDAYSYAITTADVDAGDTRTLTASALPAWLTLVDQGDGTATLSGTPGVADAGSVNVTLSANDGDGTTTQSFVIVIATRPPVAADQTYAVVGNTELLAKSSGAKLAVARGNVFTSSLADLLTNASDPDTAVSSLSAALNSGPLHGSVVLGADGSFSYAPNAGYDGPDVFSYTLFDGTQTSAPATVTLNITNRVWYLNNLTNADVLGANNPVGGDGTSIDAFDSVASLAGAMTSPGDTIYVAVGKSAYVTSTSGLVLDANQRVIGQAADLVVGATTLAIGAPIARPTITNVAGNALTLATDNTVEGLQITTTGTGVAVRGSSAANTVLRDVLIGTDALGTGIELTSHTGSFAFTNGVITASGLGTSRGLVLDGVSSPTVDLTGVTIAGVSVGFTSATSGADVRFDGGGINLTTGGRAVAVTSAATGASLVFTNGATLTATGVASGDIVSISVGVVDYDATFGPVTLSGAGADDAIALTGFGAGSVVSFGGATTITNVAGDGIEIVGSGITNVANIAFGDLSIGTAAGTDLRIDGGRPTVAATLRTGTGITNTIGASVSVANTNGASVTLGGGAIVDMGAGIRITNNGGSTISFASGVTLTPPSGTAALVATGNTTSTIAFGTLAVTSVAAPAVQVNTAAAFTIGAGTVSATGAIGAGLGLSLANIGNANVTIGTTTVTNTSGGGVALTTVGGTTRLGAVAITTTGGNGLVASSAGALTTTTGTIASTTGVALSVTNTTPTLSLTSVSASGAANGIVLDNTGTGTVTVTGTGSTLGSGGTIQNVTADAVRLASAAHVNLRYMALTNAGGNGIGGTTASVDDLDLTGLRITNAGNAVNEAGIYITAGLTGTCDFSNVVVTGSAENNVEIVATTGTLVLNVASSAFSANGAALGADGFLLETRNSSYAKAIFTGSTFAENQAAHLRANANDSSKLELRVGTSTFTATATNDTIQGIVLSHAASATLSFDIDNNTFAGPATVSPLTAHAAFVMTSADSATSIAPINGFFRNNGSISNQNFGVVIDVRANAPHAITISNNAFGTVRTRAIDYVSGVDAPDNAIGNLTITGNACSATAAGADTCALITPTQATTLCTNIRSNVFNAATASIDMFAAGATVLRLESGPTDCGGACASATAHLNARNTLIPGAATSGTTLVAPGTCATPTSF